MKHGKDSPVELMFELANYRWFLGFLKLAVGIFVGKLYQKTKHYSTKQGTKIAESSDFLQARALLI